MESARLAISIEPYYEDGTPLVHTSMYYDDGDELHIVLKQEGDGFVFTDEGHTMIWLSYSDYEFTPTRLDLMEKILSQNGSCFENGCILIRFGTPSEAGYALSSITEAIIQVADLVRLSRTGVIDTFIDDVVSGLRTSNISEVCRFEKSIQADGRRTTRADIFIDAPRPILLFCVDSALKAKDAIIGIMVAKESDTACLTVAVIDEKADIPRDDLDVLTDRADKSIMGNADMIPFVEDLVLSVSGCRRDPAFIPPDVLTRTILSART